MRDPYLYKDVDVLKNKLNIKNSDMLELAEVDESSNAINELDKKPIQGNYDFAHYCEFHKRIFGEIYDWAGIIRTIPIEKYEVVLGGLSVQYSEPKNIETDITNILNRLKNIDWNNISLTEKSLHLAEGLADLWKVHAFREGNTRTTITFICHFAESRGINLDRHLFADNALYTRNALVAASAVLSFGDYRKPEYLNRIVKDSLERAESDKSKSCNDSIG